METLKELFEGFNAILSDNINKKVGVINLNDRVSIQTDIGSRLQEFTLENFINSEYLIYLDNFDLGRLFKLYLNAKLKESERNFDIAITHVKGNGFKIYFTSCDLKYYGITNEFLLDTEVDGTDLFYIKQDIKMEMYQYQIPFKVSKKRIEFGTGRTLTEKSSVVCKVEIEKSEFEDKNLKEVLTDYLNRYKRIRERIFKEYNDNTSKFESRLKELNITIEQFEELVKLKEEI